MQPLPGLAEADRNGVRELNTPTSLSFRAPISGQCLPLTNLNEQPESRFVHSLKVGSRVGKEKGVTQKTSIGTVLGGRNEKISICSC